MELWPHIRTLGSLGSFQCRLMSGTVLRTDPFATFREVAFDTDVVVFLEGMFFVMSILIVGSEQTLEVFLRSPFLVRVHLYRYYVELFVCVTRSRLPLALIRRIVDALRYGE